MGAEIDAFTVSFATYLAVQIPGMTRVEDATHGYRLSDGEDGQIIGTSLIYFQDIGIYAGEFEVDSNTRAVRCDFNLTVLRRIDESAHTGGELELFGAFLQTRGIVHDWLELLTDPDWWAAAASGPGAGTVLDVERDPEVRNMQRVGDVFSFEVNTGLLIEGA